MVSKRQYIALSEFRARLAQFLHFSERAAQGAGVPPMQYLLLLHLRGGAEREWATVGELAELLRISHQGAVALVQRCERAGLVRKRRSASDARRVEIHLTAAARRLVERIASKHVGELKRLGEAFRVDHVTPHDAAVASPKSKQR